MKAIVLTMVGAAGILFVGAFAASALPVDGGAILRIGSQVDPVINVAKKKPCPTDQMRGKRGYCVPSRSQY
jgi:hypothetical protein